MCRRSSPSAGAPAVPALTTTARRRQRHGELHPAPANGPVRHRARNGGRGACACMAAAPGPGGHGPGYSSIGHGQASTWRATRPPHTTTAIPGPPPPHLGVLQYRAAARSRCRCRHIPYIHHCCVSARERILWEQGPQRVPRRWVHPACVAILEASRASRQGKRLRGRRPGEGQRCNPRVGASRLDIPCQGCVSSKQWAHRPTMDCLPV